MELPTPRTFVNNSKLAFGCSHTFGVGVDGDEAWAFLLNASNYGVGGCSTDYISRIFPEVIALSNPTIVYILWPDWSRFEYLNEKSEYAQSLATDKNRIQFMEFATDDWLTLNFKTQCANIQSICDINDIKLIALSLYDLIPHIDHADKWPLSKLGHHYSPEWHKWVAEIFRNAENLQPQ